jgi:hypothetical protein
MRLAGAAPPGAEALDLASFRWRYVVGSPAHLAHEPLLLDLAAELPKRLLELFGILDYDSHNRKGYLNPEPAPPFDKGGNSPLDAPGLAKPAPGAPLC